MKNFQSLIEDAFSDADIFLVGENHDDPAGKDLFANSVETFANLDVLQIREIPIWFNPILDAHRTRLEGSDGEVIVSDEVLEEMLSLLYEDTELGKKVANSIIPFHQHDPPQEIRGVDLRFDEEYVAKHDEMFAPLLGYRKEDLMQPIRQLSEELSVHFPEHAQIEAQAQDMIAGGIIPDAAVAWTALQYARNDDGGYRKIAGVYGGGHIIGMEFDVIEKNGVIDDAFEMAGFKTRSILTSRSLDPEIAFPDTPPPYGVPESCSTEGSYDGYYVANSDLAFDETGRPMFTADGQNPLRLDFGQAYHLHRFCPDHLPTGQEKYGASINITPHLQ